jgi:DNA polymerase-3 subunit alpha
MSFVHLRTQSEFSLTQGLSPIEGLVKKAAADNQPALAMTDLNGMFGAIQFYEACKSKGIKPILGVDLSIESITEDGKPFTYQLTLLAKNKKGYISMSEINSRSYLENRTKSTVAVKEEWLTSIEECVVLSGGLQGLIGQKIIAGKLDEATMIAKQMQQLFGDNFYIELQRDGSSNESTYMEGAIQICLDTGISPVATHPNFFLESDDFLAHEARYCQGNGHILYSEERPRPFNKEMYFKNTEEMNELFSDLPIAIENTQKIAQQCNLSLELGKPQLPHFPTPNGMSADDYFAEVSYKGLEKRLLEDFPDAKVRESKRKEYEDRLQFEIEVIQKMGFPGYFLIVGDFIKWAKDNEIPVGPGRGSGAGSLVAYSLEITNLDPLPYNLLFERFLNPDRVSMPDFDIDFCQQRRSEVIEYVKQKYGIEAVSQISTYSSAGAKGAVKDAARILGFHADFGDAITKNIPSDPTDKASLETLVFGEESDNISIPPHGDFGERYQNEVDFRKVMDIAIKLQGVTKGIGTHAAGVLIAPTKMSEFSPIFTMDEGSPASSQFNKDDVEKAGLVKFDFLGLKQLTSIKESIDLINQVNKANNQEPINIDKINLNDPVVFQNIFHSGNTGSIFQFESSGMTGVIKEARPNNLEDLIAINALYRPGPMDIIPEWIAARRIPEEQRTYEHPLLKEPLKETCGFMIYQEQVMQCAQIIAGYTLGGADLLRRAMGKKKPEEMAKQRSIFIEGAGKNNVDEHTASKLFDLIEKFSGYGFNKSHAAAYSLLAYQTAYLKNYYPQEFFVGTINSEMRDGDTEKVALCVTDAKNNNLNVLGVDINESEYSFTVNHEGAIRYGFGGIKGIGKGPSDSIAKERKENGPFNNFYEFLERCVDSNAINKKVLEALVRAGAFDSIHPNRSELFSNIAPALHYANELKKINAKNKSRLGEGVLISDDDTPIVKVQRVSRTKSTAAIIPRPMFSEHTEWDEMETLLQEKKAYDYYFSKNPFKQFFEKQLNGLLIKTPLNELEDSFKNGIKNVFIAGLFSEFKLWKTKTGGFFEITDGISTKKMMMYITQYDQIKEWLKKDGFVGMQVQLQEDKDGSMKIKIQTIYNWNQTRELLLQRAFLAIEPEKLDETLKVLEPFIVDRKSADAVPFLICNKPTDDKVSARLQLIPVKRSAEMLDFCLKNFEPEFFKCTYLTDSASLPKPFVKGNNKKNSRY